MNPKSQPMTARSRCALTRIFHRYSVAAVYDRRRSGTPTRLQRSKRSECGQATSAVIDRRYNLIGIRAGREICALILATLVVGAGSGRGATNAPAVPPSAEFQPRLTTSVYQPVAPRDPFLKPGASNLPGRLTTANPALLHLDGFLGSTNNLTAIVNGLALNLNQPVVLETPSGRIQIKAVQITFARVIVEVGGQRVELKRTTENPAPKPAP